MKIVVLDEAQRRFEAADAWWREHRDAEDLLAEEFEQALRQLSTAPVTGQCYRRHRGKLIRRWRMPKTACHVYYFHDVERNVLEIHSIWGARRGRGPRLPR